MAHSSLRKRPEHSGTELFELNWPEIKTVSSNKMSELEE